ncbi:MAG: Crp/Fnr family transcriptional regulator [Bacteroidetes bacterium OLB12]|nr:MAG: Crp/Fnr family transcriptional regulator [Bacteroidetes bacterium OLB12]
MTADRGVGLRKQIGPLMIDPLVLQSYGAREISLQKDEILFREGEEALNYFQVRSGAIKMITNSPDGQEFIQGVFKSNDSFGEPALLCSFPYPSHAIALEPSVIIKLSKEKFLTLLRENFEIHLHLDQVLCQRLRYKSMVLSELSFYDPEHRIMSLLKYLKDEARQTRRGDGMVRSDHVYEVPFTRQQLADMSGLRVETVIRTVKRMEEDGKLKLVGRKIVL